ncbi:hypothetical protein KAT80_01995 [Candidatus Pacearchaeota archaeon]|nr:hypothetical protein [Candidatus Pacearchaeota archaeon]
MIKYFVAGFLTKLITGVDDTLTQIPLISNFTQTKKGKIAYSIGIILAISLAVLLSVLFIQILIKIPNYRYFAAGLIFILAIIIYFDIFDTEEKKKLKKKLKKLKPISRKRFLRLILIGFLASFATIIDDTIAFSSILFQNQVFVISGIFLAAFTEIFLILTFSKQINKLKYKKEISTIGLIILSFLVFFGVI